MCKTKLRSDAMHTKYLTFTKDPEFMKTAPSLAEYSYWRIIENAFPYDTIANRHHMLVPKRKFAKRNQMTKPERVEFDVIVDTYLEDYDMIALNTPKNRTVPDWLHYHLLVLK